MAKAFIYATNYLFHNDLTYVGWPLKPTYSLHNRPSNHDFRPFRA